MLASKQSSHYVCTMWCSGFGLSSWETNVSLSWMHCNCYLQILFHGSHGLWPVFPVAHPGKRKAKLTLPFFWGWPCKYPFQICFTWFGRTYHRQFKHVFFMGNFDFRSLKMCETHPNYSQSGYLKRNQKQTRQLQITEAPKLSVILESSLREFETCNCSNFHQGIKLGLQSSRPWLLELVSNFTVQMSQLRPTVWKHELCHKLLWYFWAPKCNWVSRLSSMSRFKRLRQSSTNLKSSKLLLVHVNTLSWSTYRDIQMMKAHTNHRTLTQQEALPKTMGFLEYQVMPRVDIGDVIRRSFIFMMKLRGARCLTRETTSSRRNHPDLLPVVPRCRRRERRTPGLIFRLVALILTKHGCNQVVSW